MAHAGWRDPEERETALANTRGVLKPLLALIGLTLGVALLAGAQGPGDDWPTYNHDARRSAVSTGSLDVAMLQERWSYAPAMPPRPAWPGPAERDYYNTPAVDNEDRLDLDSVYHIAAVGDAVFVPSSGEDSLRCLDALTGEVRWTYTTDGPVRFAPHVVGDRVYFGSDDGHAYCVSATDGRQIWRRLLAQTDHYVPSDGKLVSLWPNRTGVIVQDGTVYCAAGVFPSEGVYVCALDAETGSPIGEGRYHERYTDMSLQGYILASATNLYIPGGRGGPWVFERAGGKRLAQLGGGGGTYALITSDDSLLYGPGRNTPIIEEFGGESRDRLASFPGAKHMVVTSERSYISTKTELSALDRERWIALGRQMAEALEALKSLESGSAEHEAQRKKIETLEQQRDACVAWRIDANTPDALILVGDHLVAGGAGRVAVFDAADGREVWSATVDGAAKGLAAARGRLFVSTDAHRLYCFE